MRLLFIGDVVGKPGRQLVAQLLPSYLQEEQVDLVVANGENAAGGLGITPEVAAELFALGVDVLTSGNHLWDKKEVMPFLDREERLLRPLNWPGDPPGRGSLIMQSRSGIPVAVVCAMGRVFAPVLLDCPFRALAREVERLRAEARVVLVDFHAEATSEKVAMGWFLDGRVSAVIGTHTHVQTADEAVLPGGTAYISDVGMTGPWHSVIGMRTETIVQRFLDQLPSRFDVARGPRQFNAVVVDVDESTGMARSIRRLFHREASSPASPTAGSPDAGP
ncbi:MAG: TIGR00282 family metallophosphoesterase [Bacillota bacterium]|nr:TIGR00282 family metallophosphoesterase [Bacillota bacterium]